VSENADEKMRELKDLSGQVPAAARRVGDQAEKIQETAHFLGEVASADLEFLNATPPGILPPEEISRNLEAWQATLDKTVDMLGDLRVLSAGFASTSYAVSSTTANTVSFVLDTGVARTSALDDAIAVLDKIFRRAPLFDEVRAELRRLGLDKRGGQDRAALDLLDAAKRGVDKGDVSALFTARESIYAAVSELFRRKPKQGPGGGLEEKLILNRRAMRPARLGSSALPATRN